MLRFSGLILTPDGRQSHAVTGEGMVTDRGSDRARGGDPHT